MIEYINNEENNVRTTPEHKFELYKVNDCQKYLWPKPNKKPVFCF